MANDEAMVVRGVVRAAHGLRGLLKVALQTDFPERVTEARELELRLPDQKLVTYRLERAETYRDGLLLKLVGIDDRTAADGLRGAQIVARREALPQLAPDEIYWHELIGLKVVTTDGRQVGTITDILRTGSNDVYVTEVPSATGRNTVPGPLIPAIDDVLERIDTEAGQVIIKPMPGLLDEG